MRTGYQMLSNGREISALVQCGSAGNDEDKETVAELLLIDDDTLLVDDELLKGLDKELDEFLKNLLEK